MVTSIGTGIGAVIDTWITVAVVLALAALVAWKTVQAGDAD